MNYIKMPYLPQKRVALLIADCDVPGTAIVPPPRIKCLPYSMQRHADLGICIVSERTAVCPPDTFGYYSAALSPYGFSVVCGKSALGSNYPQDSAYNVGIAGNYCFMNTKICDSVLKEKISESKFTVLDVKQGYSKCSMCALSENLILTSDMSIKRACEKNGIDTIFTDSSFVRLGGFSYGFIGGAVTMIDKDTLLFNGSVPKNLPLLKELEKRGIRTQFLHSGPLLDIGSLIPLMTT